MHINSWLIILFFRAGVAIVVAAVAVAEVVAVLVPVAFKASRGR